MTDDLLLSEGDIAVVVQVSPCVGGLVQTWLDDGSSRLWSTPDAEWLLGVQGNGLVGRTPREERRFREAALLIEESATLLVQSRVPVAEDAGNAAMRARPVRLERARDAGDTVLDDFRGLLTRAVEHCVESGEFLVVEKGGWDPPDEPYCLFILVDEDDGPV